MPLYDFNCHHCGHKFETFVKSKKTHTICQNCGQLARKQFPKPNFRITGFNSKNGYNLPEWGDLMDEEGYQR